jgi:hypothetical protein
VKLPIQVKRRGLTAAMAAATAALALYAGAGPAAAAGNPAAGSPAAGSPAAAKPAATPHVMVIMMENTDYSQAIGSAAMPYLNELAHEYTGFTQSYGWHYPSLPNYM